MRRSKARARLCVVWWSGLLWCVSAKKGIAFPMVWEILFICIVTVQGLQSASEQSSTKGIII